MNKKLSTIISWVIIVGAIILAILWFAWIRYYPWTLWFKGYSPKPTISISIANSMVNNNLKKYAVSINKSALLNDYISSNKFAQYVDNPLVISEKRFFKYIKYKKDSSDYSGEARHFYYIFYPVIGSVKAKITKCKGDYSKQRCNYTCNVKYNKNYIKFKQKFSKSEWLLLLSNPENNLILIKKPIIGNHRKPYIFYNSNNSIYKRPYINGASIVNFYRTDKDKWKLNYSDDLCLEFFIPSFSR
ncbi:MAG: hypothetical protein ACYDEG_05180 [bacterium]